MTDQQPAVVPEEVAQAARVRLAEWLTAQAPLPELGTTAAELAAWTAYHAGECVVLVPPGYANLLFLVADHGIRSFAPSEQTLERAMAELT
ncbi:hypothetical protein AB0H36_14015 [Kribbella sp. NPDC050820]|uniref:hypothetical protein n=1 Tax=Kribbella sp. NPDC050820 TaxID=3155408 RepID=UPI0033CD4A90